MASPFWFALRAAIACRADINIIAQFKQVHALLG
jgi:hypothetical protein